MPKTLQIGQEMKKKSTDSKKIPIFSQIIEFEGLSYTILFKTEKKKILSILGVWYAE